MLSALFVTFRKHAGKLDINEVVLYSFVYLYVYIFYQIIIIIFETSTVLIPAFQKKITGKSSKVRICQ